jgi:hypothetical protein
MKDEHVKLANLRLVAAGLLAAMILPGPAVAQELSPPPVARWYEALRTADREAFSALIAPDGEIELKYLGLVQGRDEFIGSLGDWEQLAREGKILTRQVSSSDSSAVVEVCYRFPEAEKMNRETFEIEGDQITRVTEEEAGAGCPGFEP